MGHGKHCVVIVVREGITVSMKRRMIQTLATLVLFVAPQGWAEDSKELLPAAVAAELQELSLTQEDAPMGVDPSVLLQFYGERENAPMWSGDDLAFTRAEALVARLEDAAREGLEPDAYADAITAWKTREPAPDAHAAARLELLLSAATVRYVTDLAFGRIDPSSVSEELFDIPRRPDAVNLLWDVQAVADVGLWLDGMAPPWPQYRALRRALAGLRTLEEDDAAALLPDGDSLKPGMHNDLIPILRERLTAFGVALDGDSASTVFDPELEAAVMAFQRHHGLDDDGVVGRKTRAMLNMTVAQRIRIVELNMERLRWLQEDLGNRYIWINIPAFQLSVIEDGQEVLAMDVIVGRDYRSTPVFSGLMTYVDFNPYWNVPHKLAVEDILPKVQADPEYLASHGFKVFAGWTSDEPLDPATIDWNSLTETSFGYRLRQDPGEHNALGRVKFMLPNEHSIYLHDTPNRALFSRAERAFSSGCVRLSQPVDMALYLLGGSGDWSQERLDEIWAEPELTRVSLERPIPVYFSYMTAWVDQDGVLQFRADVYQRDVALDAVLSAH
jgi:murein L,D-transpeptidase YcbB/YkuD